MRHTGFLNVDLEIESSEPLDALAEAFGETLHLLHAGPGAGRRHLLCMESPHAFKTPDAAAAALCKAIEQLPSVARMLWVHASRKTFDFGYSLAPGARNVQSALKPETLRRIVALGATIAFTCYREGEGESGSIVQASQRPPRKRPLAPSPKTRTGVSQIHAAARAIARRLQARPYRQGASTSAWDAILAWLVDGKRLWGFAWDKAVHVEVREYIGGLDEESLRQIWCSTTDAKMHPDAGVEEIGEGLFPSIFEATLVQVNQAVRKRRRTVDGQPLG